MSKTKKLKHAKHSPRKTHAKKHVKKQVKKLAARKVHVKVVKAKHNTKHSVKHAPKHTQKKVEKKDVKKLTRRQKRENLALPTVEITKKNLEIIGTAALSEYVKANVGNGAQEILTHLAGGPQTDDALAEKLSMKINDVRRMLNVMNGYSIVRYDITKDNKGWLIFKWRIDNNKLPEFTTSLNQKQAIATVYLPENVNDFFMCKTCYLKDRIVVPFDTAFESSFKCVDCGKKYEPLTRAQAEELYASNSSVVAGSQ